MSCSDRTFYKTRTPCRLQRDRELYLRCTDRDETGQTLNRGTARNVTVELQNSEATRHKRISCGLLERESCSCLAEQAVPRPISTSYYVPGCYPCILVCYLRDSLAFRLRRASEKPPSRAAAFK